MFNSKKIKKALLSILGSSVMFCNNAALAVKYAKIAWVGTKGTGKTTLHKAISDETEKVGNYMMTMSINSQEVLFKFEAEDVISYFWDLPGVEDHISTNVVKEFYEDSNVAIVMINTNQIRNENNMLFNNQAYTFQHIRDVLKKCPNCKIIFGVIKLQDEKDLLFKNEVVNYIKNVLCTGALESHVVGWMDIPNIDTLNSKEGRAKCKEEVLALVKKAIEAYGVNNLPNTSKNLHGRLKWDYQTENENYWAEEYTDEDGCGGKKKKKVLKSKELIVNKRLILEKW